MEFRVVLTVPDFDEAVAFYRDALGLEQLAGWSGKDGPSWTQVAPRSSCSTSGRRRASTGSRLGSASPDRCGWRSR
jgi:catechol 2,3-dioxygenase-like lactoylglutathione lyase family enzyme